MMSMFTALSTSWSLLSGLSTRAKVEICMGMTIAAGLVAGWLWVSDLKDVNQVQAEQLANQRTSITTLTNEKEQLATSKAISDAQRDAYAQRTEALNQENQENEQQAQHYQAESEAAQQQLRQLQAQDLCAGHAVPAGVVRVQQQAVSDFNAQYQR
ncbi:hypothetical protein [Nissabacter sp. SGAir0207]|uniref:hypothetical protein n=1 Tax=Nissabacter sp. SGAir0207 TaxID=2126321 RepID=UPI0010CD2BD4|nr:hypothetical protein [Nissabacter sp. SGAir0207]QCR38739.1 hypothetical protein C1N62_21640 [Nissabacter sp. SGAir0207]